MKASHVFLASLMITSVVHGQPSNWAVSPAGLVSWWRAENSTLDNWDSNDGSTNVSFAPGKVGQAFRFGQQYVMRVLDSSSLRLTNALSIEAWVNPSVLGLQSRAIVAKVDLNDFGPLITAAGGFSLSIANNDLNGQLEPTRSYTGGVTYKVNNGLADSGLATVSLEILPVNDAPVAQSQSVALDEDTAVPIVLGALDVDGDPLTYSVGAPAHGMLSGVAPNLVYRPATNYYGPDSFTFSAHDGQTNSNIAMVSLTVRPMNDAPVGKIAISPLLTNVRGLTNLVTLAAVCGDARVLLDCSTSRDTDNDPLSFTWFDYITNAIATGQLATNLLKVGKHEISLQISDGAAIGNAHATLEVISLAQALGIVISLAEASDLSRRDLHPLIVSLQNAARAFERCDAKAGINQLEVFKRKLRVQLEQQHPEQSAEMINVVDQVLTVARPIPTSVSTTISVVVPGDAGYSYTVQSGFNLSGGEWRDLTNIVGAGSPVATVWPCIFAQEYFRWRQTPVETGGDLWYTLPQSASFDVVEAIARSPDGTIVVAANEGGVNLSLMKYTPSGERLWQQVFFGTISPRAVTVARDGGVYVTGYYVGNQNLGGTNLPGSLSQRFIFVAKYAADGSHIWSRGFGSSAGHSSGNGVAVDAGGGVYISGYFAGADFGDGFVLGNSGGSGFVSSYSASGAFRWKRTFGVSLASCNSMGIDAGGNLYLAGVFFQTLDLGGAVLTTPNYAGWIAKLNPIGSHFWSRQFGEFKNNDFRYGANGLAVSGNSVCIAGTYIGSINLGGSTFTANSSSFFDVFFARYSASGAHEWSTVLTSTAPSTGWGLAAAADDTGMLFTGRFYGTAQFGNGQSVTQVENLNSFIAKYSPAGQCQWVRSLPGNNEGHCVLLGGSAFAGGWFTGTTTFDKQTHSSVANIQGTPSQDGYLIKIQ